MQNITQYANSPIVEALIDIQVVPSDQGNIENLNFLKDALNERFPVADVKRSISTNVINTLEGPQVEQTEEVIGHVLKTADNKQVVQFTNSSFTFSMLKPYSNWNDYIHIVDNLWNEYKTATSPMHIQRVGIRYINKIDVPNGADYTEYVATAPYIAENIPQDVEDVFMRIVLPHPDGLCKAIITETIDVSNVTDRIYPFILDIDVFKQAFIPMDAVLDDLLAPLRQFKNLIFEESITEKTREIIS